MRRILLAVGLLAGCDYVFRLDTVPDIPSQPDAPAVAGRWTQATGGYSHTCAIDDDGALFCWGRNDYGQTGTDTSVYHAGVTRVGSDTWTTISSIEHTTCGIQANGSLWCWGRNYAGMVGNGTSDQAETPQPIAGSWIAVDAGHQHTCGIRADHSLWCWGFNGYGELGDATTTTRLAPVASTTLVMWDSVATGGETSCAIATDHSLWCWGLNDRGQLGTGTTGNQTMPVKIGADTWAAIGVGASFACGITEAGQLQCWGNNAVGQLGDGTMTQHASPAPVLISGQPRTDWRELAVGTRHACGITMDGSLFCWGGSDRSPLGITRDAVPVPIQIAGPQPWLHVAAGGGHTCAIAVDHTLFCMGADGFSQLGDMGTSPTTPVRLPESWIHISAGEDHTCAIDAAGAVSCAGANSDGELGNGAFRSRDVMTRAMNTTGYAQIAAGRDHTCGIANNQLWCWGSNYNGEFGNGTTTSSASPVQIRAATTVAVNRHTCSIDMFGVMSCSGDNESGQAGPTNVGGSVIQPTTIAGTWIAVSAGSHHTCAIDNGKAVYCWGSQDGGALGNDADLPTLAPTPQATGISANDVSVGAFHSCALAGIVLTCWGANYDGQLGLGTTDNATSPQTVQGDWFAVAAGYEQTCGIRVDRSLWCWGGNRHGQLGLGSRSVEVLAPAQVGTDTDWQSVSASFGQTCAIKIDNSTYCWGDDDEGQLADGRAWGTVLVQVP